MPIDNDGLITSGTASFRPGRYDGGGMRYLRFTNWLTELDRLSAAQRIIEDWRTDYNHTRPHTSLRGLTPSEFATRSRRDRNENRVQL